MVAHTTHHTFLIGPFAKSDSFHCSRCILQYLNQYPYSCNNIFEPHTLLTHTYSLSISQFVCESLGICYFQRYSTTRKNSCKTISRSSVGHVPWTLMLRLPPGHMKLNQVHASGSGPYWPTDPSHLASNELSLSCALNPHYLPTCGPGTISSPHPLPTPDPLSSPAAAPTPSQAPSIAPMQLCHQRESPSNPD